MPFIGKSSYNEEFLSHSTRDRAGLIKPRDMIKTIEMDSKLESEYNKSMKRIKSK